MVVEGWRVCRYPARPESVRATRAAVARELAGLGLESGLRGDLLLVATELCSNAVVHAYRGGEGFFELSLLAAPDRVVLEVRDDGSGIEAGGGSDGAGLGMALVEALSTKLVVASGTRGTRVRATFEAAKVERACE